MEWYLKALRQFADFSGRARRKEFWTFTLVNGMIGWALGFVDRMLGLNFVPQSNAGILYVIFVLATLVPALAVLVRRTHDVGKSGWSLLILLIPVVGAVIVIIRLVKEGEPQDNAYGPDPKAEPEFALA